MNDEVDEPYTWFDHFLAFMVFMILLITLSCIGRFRTR